MKKKYGIRIESSIFNWVVGYGHGSFTKGIEHLYNAVYAAKRRKEEGEVSRQSESIINKSHKLQEESNDIMSRQVEARDKDTEYRDLLNNLSATMQSKLSEIIRNTAKGNYREDGQEYTKNELLIKQGLEQFIGLIP